MKPTNSSNAEGLKRPAEMHARGLPDPAACPVKERAEQTLNGAHTLLADMQRLRVALQACQTCPRQWDCPFVQAYASAVTLAIAEVAEAWNLGSGLSDV